ncbi:MAG TPA: arginine decarboxylase [Roseiflexaceae bacterium]|nr:arginine decarboxylase [Roseiflexaceae bacterium]
MNKQSFARYFEERFGISSEGQLTDFLSRRDGHLLLGHAIDLNAMVERYGAPLEVAYCPQIGVQVDRMQGWAAEARRRSGYHGEFIYAYATKANFAEEVVRTALEAGVHYETSATADVIIAHQLWRQGVLSADRWMFCNGSKDEAYIDAIVAMRAAGFERIVPVIDDIDELEHLIARSDQPLFFGVRERHAAADVDPAHPGAERFGLLPAEIDAIARRLSDTPHTLVLYHAMVGSQMEQAEAWAARLDRSLDAYIQLRRLAPDLSMFNFGGGMPTSAYAVDFQFDYAGFLEQLMCSIQVRCERYHEPVPAIVGEFGRYTVASHNVFLIEVGAVKQGQGEEPWYLINGSLMVSLPDMLFVEGQQFIVLPLGGWEAPVQPVRLGGRYTCDSDDFFPRGSQPPLMLPATGERLVLAIFGVGAYQQMIAGRGGAHHCLMPEMRRVLIERDDDAMVVREIQPQSLLRIMELLGYSNERLEPTATRLPAMVAERTGELPRAQRAGRRAQSLYRPRTPGSELRGRRARL